MNPGWLFQEIGRAIGASIKGTFDKQMRRDEGMCADWLAVLLGWMGVAVLSAVVAAEAIRVFTPHA